MPLRAVIFDMDGVLWQSASIHDQAFRGVLATVGVTDFDYKAVAGQRTAEVIQAVLRARGVSRSDEEVARLAADKSARALDMLRKVNPVTDQAIDVILRLSAQLPIALASSASAASVSQFLDANGVRGLFRAVVTGADVKRAKPAPDLFLAAAAGLGVAPEDCLVVEDSASGVAGARNAGCQVVRFAPDARPELTLTAGEPPAVRELSDLLPLIGVNTQRIWEAGALKQLQRARNSQARWTTIIAAAGRGTRLGFDRPKVLYPVAERPLLDWLLDLFGPRTAEVVVVVSPSGQASVQAHLRSLGSRARTVIQEEALGMADAVMRGLSAVDTPDVMVVWGDQAALLPETIEAAQRLHEAAAPLATVPTSIRSAPYIHFRRDQSGRVLEVLQAREGSVMPAEGESDAGLFLFKVDALRHTLRVAIAGGALRGARTDELNLLPVLPLLDRLPGGVLTARIASDAECIGINTPEDAGLLALVLAGRRRSQANSE